METLSELRARAAEVAREHEWMQDLIAKMADRMSAQRDAHTFRLLCHQSIAVGQRRVELQMRIAELEGQV
jgi:hypothetical protein